MDTPEQLDTIRRLNDAARQFPGTASIANVTIGFHALPAADRLAALAAIVGFTVRNPTSSRSRFLDDGDQRSNMMAIRIPR